MKHHFSGRLAVCSWSLQPKGVHELIEQMREMKTRYLQIALDPLHENPGAWQNFEDLFEKNNMMVISGMLRCLGEDYSTLETIKRTGGIAPDETWPGNLENFRAGAVLAARLNLRLVSFHAGFLPHKGEKGFNTMIFRLNALADLFDEYGIVLGLETGQETAEELADLLGELNRKNVGVNFDPANMILYNKGDPVRALRILNPWLKQIHIKDATYTQTPGTWGDEVAVGDGDVDWEAFFEESRRLNYTGDFAIEREAGTQRAADIRTGLEYISKYLN